MSSRLQSTFGGLFRLVLVIAVVVLPVFGASKIPGMVGDKVDAVVDFSALDARRVELSDDGTSVTVTLPASTLGEPRLDIESSYVADRDQGFIDGFQGSDLERRAQLKAIEQMATAATGAGNLVDLAEESTTAMLRGLFGSLGYTTITVNFDD